MDDVKIEEQILLSELIENFPDKIHSENVVSMEKLPINNNSGIIIYIQVLIEKSRFWKLISITIHFKNSGQSYGYIVYRKTNINLKAHAILKITGYVRDHVLVLVNGKLVNQLLTRLDDLNGFG